MAQIMGTGGDTWYIVKTKSGSVGWIRAADSGDVKKLESFFSSLPQESSLSVPREISLPPSFSGARKPIVVPVYVSGSAVIVPVTLNRKVQTYMVLDTGATYTVISRQLAANLNLQVATYASLMTANGVIRAALSQLTSLQVGEAEATGLTVAIHDVSPHPRIGGLLGLNYLSQFHTSLDSRRNLLTLAPR
ncbi:MAG TPA: retropepsin-like aspartic protease [Candidatus Binatia bacterium]|nr:retropepsin-like aspartic protease [Candidatus Binatia bacterium]